MPRLTPLPDCDGPKLEAFTDDLLSHKIEIISVIAPSETQIHSAVYKAKIDEKIYALKCFTGGPDLDTHLGDEMFPEVDFPKFENASEADKDLMIRHATPFYSECRAFGRLKELGMEHLAVKAYGYACLPPNELAEKIFVRDAQDIENRNRAGGATDGRDRSFQTGRHREESICRWFDHYTKGRHALDDPIMIIVKDWVSEPAYESPAYGSREECDSFILSRRRDRIPQMLDQLHELHRCGIVVRDICYRQYVDGTLVDLSLSWTTPHVLGPERGLWPSWTFASLAVRDLLDFQTHVLDYWNSSAHRRRAKGTRKINLRAHDRFSDFWEGNIYSDNVEYRRVKHLRHLDHRFNDLVGPQLPLLTHNDHILPMIQSAQYDPATFDWKRVEKG